MQFEIQIKYKHQVGYHMQNISDYKKHTGLPGKGSEALERYAYKFITQQRTARGVMSLHFTCRSSFQILSAYRHIERSQGNPYPNLP